MMKWPIVCLNLLKHHWTTQTIQNTFVLCFMSKFIIIFCCECREVQLSFNDNEMLPSKKQQNYNHNWRLNTTLKNWRLVIITARNFYRNSTHLANFYCQTMKMNDEIFNLFTILHPKKQKYPSSSKMGSEKKKNSH